MFYIDLIAPSIKLDAHCPLLKSNDCARVSLAIFLHFHVQYPR